MTIKITIIFLSLVLTLLVTACSESSNNSSIPISNRTQDIRRDLAIFATNLVVSTKNNIFNPVVEKSKYYQITFETLDPALMKEPSNNALANNAANALWGAKFCTEELKALIIKHNLKRVEGRIIKGKMFLAACDGSGDTSNELLEKDISVEMLKKASKVALMNVMIDFDILEDYSLFL